MTLQSPPIGGLAVLAEAFRAKRTGTLVLGEEPSLLRARLEHGQIVALGPAPAAETVASLPKPNDSVRLRLERVLSEIGMRKPAASSEPGPPASLRDRVIERLGDESAPARFEEGAEAPAGLLAVAVATEPLILEAVRQMHHDETVRRALGDLDRRLLATPALADERTLTLTEGYLLSRIDGTVSAREVLQLAPLDPRETERSLLGLLLTGRVESRPAAAVVPEPTQPTVAMPQVVMPTVAMPAVEMPAVEMPGASELPAAEPDAAPATAEPIDADAPVPDVAAEEVVDARAEELADADAPIVEAVPDDEVDAVTGPQAAAPVQPTREPIDPKVAARRRDIVAFYQSLPFKQSHFDMLGVEAGCTDEEVKKAYITLTKRYHPDANRDKRLDDLHDMLEAIIIRVGEAWEVIGEARSRASYEARAGIVRRPRPAAASGGTPPPPAAPATSAGAAPPPAAPPAYPSPDDEPAYVSPEEILQRARRLLAQARYWDAIQLLETTVSAMEPRRQQHRGRLLLARAYSKNPNWLRRAEEMLQEMVREDPTNADTHYELGLVYKTGGFVARAQGMFRRALELRPGHKEAAAELGIQTEDPSGGGGLLKRLFKRGKAS
jgi:curved DNA-binding protein CbpA